MKLLLFLAVALAASSAGAITKVALVDTGFNGPKEQLCDSGHYDFVDKKAQVGFDQQGHGTIVAAAVKDYAGKAKFCFLVYKVFGEKRSGTPLNSISNAIDMAVANGAYVINLSLEGPIVYIRERDAIANAVKHHVKVQVAAGNGHYDLDMLCSVFPACYHIKGMAVVGSVDAHLETRGNYGRAVTEFQPYCYKDACGTSISTGISTGKLLNKEKSK